MHDPILYIDTSEVREGKLPELKSAIEDLILFVNDNVPRIIFYSVYLSNDNNNMSVVQMHPDAASLEQQMQDGMPVFAKFKDLLQLKSIDLYGKPTENLLTQLKQKATVLGDAMLTIHDLHAGINKFKLNHD